ncbi:MAG TPA: hypothetical protein VGJ82_14255 [Thermoanaerobaculia bacterium]|jgi:hypothetical protein
METLPKKLASYIHDTGSRALDHLAESVDPPEEGAEPDPLQMLLGHWRSMTPEQKDAFVSRVSASVGEVIAASALLPVGIKIGKKAVKSAKKILKKSARTLKKNAKTAKKKAKTAKGGAAKAEKKARPAPSKPARRAKRTNAKTKKTKKRSAK